MHDLSDTQMIALAALLSGKTVPEAAQASGINPTTVRRWLKQDDFAEALAAGRRESLSRAMSTMADATQIAVQTVISVMKNSRALPHVRLAAAKIIIDSVTRWQDLQDVEDRLKKLEGRNAGS